MRLTLLSAGDLERALPMPAAIEAMKRAFAELSAGRATMPQRLVLPVPEARGTTLVKPALAGGGLGAKLVSVFPGNRERGLPVVSGLVVLLDAATGQPAALLDGTFLTAWRTGAASGAATDLLARRDARRAALIGCGAQARTQARAIDAVRELAELRVWARTPASVERFVGEMQPLVRARLRAAASAAEALAGADVVCTATSSSTPVFDGRLLEPGTHLNGVGSFTPAMREVDGETVARSRVFVDSRAAALAEAGELIAAVDAGRTAPGDWSELGEVIERARPGRRAEDEITFFKSVGVAVQDVVAGQRALEAARRLGLGTRADL